MKKRHHIQFPPQDANDLRQDEVSFYLFEDGQKQRLRFHDYDKIYLRPGLYEQIFYDRLKCNSPTKVGEILKRTIDFTGKNFNELRVLDLGAGNGIMGEVLKNYGIARLVGVDIISEAKAACDRDRPGLYDEFYVADFTRLTPELTRELNDWSIDCLVSVAALGFGDIPPSAFFRRCSLCLPAAGWPSTSRLHSSTSQILPAFRDSFAS